MEKGSIAHSFRQINDKEAPISRRVDVARQIYAKLAGASTPNADPSSHSTSVAHGTGAASPLQAVPVRVRMHYASVLLDWTVSALLRGCPSLLRGDPAKRGEAGARTASKLWALLAALLRLPGTAASGAAVNPALVSRAAQTCQWVQDASTQHADAAELGGLGSALLDALQLLARKDSLQFAPSLEHSVALAEAAVGAAAALRRAEWGMAGQAAGTWVEVASHALGMLRSVVASHPNQRKVYTAVVGRLLVPLLRCSAAAPGQPSSPEWARLVAAGRQLIDAVIFHAAHMQELAELAELAVQSAPSAHSVAEQQRGGTDKKPAEAPADDQPGGSRAAAEQPRSYVWALFQELSSCIAQGELEGLPAVLEALPWLLGRFKAALGRHARAAASVAAALAEATPSAPRSRGRGAGAVAHAPAASFGFFALLLQPLLAGIEAAAVQVPEALAEEEDGRQLDAAKAAPAQGKRKRAEQKKALHNPAKRAKVASGERSVQPRRREEAWPVLVQGAAQLVAAMKSLGVYQATEDASGTQRALLTCLGAAVLAPFQEKEEEEGKDATGQAPEGVHAQPAAPGAAPEAEPCVRPGEATRAAAGAAARAADALMAVEHRALQAHLEPLWRALWACCAPDQAGAAAAGRAAGEAAEVAGRLVQAYGELRQVEQLLASLAAATAQGSCPAGAMRVVGSPAFADALRQVIHDVPPGQAPAIVRFVSGGVPALEGASAPGVRILSALLAGCLEGLCVESTTAPVLAIALEALVRDALGPLLRRHLVPTAKGTPLQPLKLAALLRLYELATSAHSACAALQPQIAPLPGRAIDLWAILTKAASPLGTYFLALGSSPEAASEHLPDLLALNDVEDWAPLSVAVRRCLLQHLEVLHARLLSMRFSCPLHGAEGGAAPAALTAAAAPPSGGSKHLEAAEGKTAAAAASVADALVDAAERCAPQQGPDNADASAAGGSDVQVLTLVLTSALTVFAHAAAPQRGVLLRLALRCSVQEHQPVQQQGKGRKVLDVGLSEACARSRELLAGAGLYEVAQLDAEWPCAVASLLLEQLRAALQPLQAPQGAGRNGKVHDLRSRPGKQRKAGSVQGGAHNTVAAWEDAAAVLVRFAGESADQERPGSPEASSLDALLGTAASLLSARRDSRAPESSAAMNIADIAGVEPMRQVERLFSLLASIPPAYFAARGACAAALAECTLAAEAVLGLVHCSTAGTDGDGGAQQGAAAACQAASALQAAHGFLRQLSRAGCAPVLATLTPDGAAALDWLFGVTTALAASQHGSGSPDNAGAAAGDGRRDDQDAADGRGTLASFAVSMLYASRSIACSVAAHCLAAGVPEPVQASLHSPAIAAATAAPASSAAIPGASLSFLQGPLTGLAPSKGASRNGQHEPAVKLVAAAQLCAAAEAVASAATASCSAHRSKAASSIVAGPVQSGAVAPASLLAGMLGKLQAACVEHLDAAGPAWASQSQRTMEFNLALASLLRAAACLLTAERLLISEQEANAEALPKLQRRLHGRVGQHMALAQSFLQEERNLPEQAVLDAVAYLRAVARALPAMQDALPVNMPARMLALLLHLLGTLLPSTTAPGPGRRMNMPLLTIVPSLDSALPGSTARKTLLLAVRDLVSGCSSGFLGEVYRAASDMLADSSTDPARGQPVLEVLLIIMEAAHAPAALRALRRTAEGIAAALTAFLQDAALRQAGMLRASNAAAAVCTALRCLESLLSREAAVPLLGHNVALALGVPAQLLADWAPARSAADWAGVHVGCCCMLGAAVRHRSAEVRRTMALVAAGARALLGALLTWRSPRHALAAQACAIELGHLYEAVAERKDLLGMYCHVLLADYIALAAAPGNPPAAAAGAGALEGLPKQDGGDAAPGAPGLLPAAAAALRPGACALYGACSPAQVQHVYTVLQKSGGGTRRAAMAELRQEYERSLKFSGKV